MELRNKTPFALAQTVVLDKHGAEHLVVGLKATYTIVENGTLAIAEEQEPICTAETFYGEPDSSSIEHEAELCPPKLATDVILHADAVPPRPDATKMLVALVCGPVSKRVAVFGDRTWERTAGMSRVSQPAPIERVPLIWEHTFGGVDDSPKKDAHMEGEARNPVGRGLFAKKTERSWIATQLPNIEDPNDLIRSPDQRTTPMGFGFVGRGWQPRSSYVGTYDEQWMKTRIPLLPLDFDDRFHSAAPADQVVPGRLRGGERVSVVGCTKQPKLEFALPVVRPRASLEISDRREDVELALDTVLIDTRRMQLRLLYKGQTGVHGEVERMQGTDCWLEGEGS